MVHTIKNKRAAEVVDCNTKEGTSVLLELHRLFQRLQGSTCEMLSSKPHLVIQPAISTEAAQTGLRYLDFVKKESSSHWSDHSGRQPVKQKGFTGIYRNRIRPQQTKCSF
jgi:hypothetical protein